MAFTVQAQEVKLLKDINNTTSTGSSYPSYITAFGTSVIFNAYDPVNGNELWISNGSSGGTTLLKDIYPGGQGSYPYNLVNVGGIIYFQADDGVHGGELWKTNGTPAGTVLIKDINPGPGSSNPYGFMAMGGKVYFSAFEPIAGTELWETDGTGTNTLMSADIFPGNNGSNPNYLTTLGTKLIFNAYTSTNGSEVYSYDGTTPFLIDIVSGSGSSYPSQFTSNGTYVVFEAYTPADGYELYTTVGAGALLININSAAAASSYPSYITVMGGNFYFQAYTAANGYELWKSNGANLAGTARITDDNALAGSSYPQGLVAAGSYLYYYSYDGSNYAIRYTTGGGSTVVAGTNNNGASYMVSGGNGLIYFEAYDVTNGYELWKVSVGTATVVKDILPGSSGSYPNNLVYTNQLFFAADDATKGNELWISDGTLANTTIVKDINSSTNSNIQSIVATTTGFLFGADNGVTGNELWKSDGTSAGTSLVKDIQTGSGGANPYFIGNIGTTYFFTADNGTIGTELWKTDGTAVGTALVMDINPGLNGSYPSNGVTMGGFLYFIAFHPSYYYELWKTNGTTTSMVGEVCAGTCGYAYNLTVAGTTLFYEADDGVNGYELWKSDGTTVSLVRNINAAGGSYPNQITPVGTSVYFTADDGVNGTEVWVSNGTFAGTVLAKDINTTGPSYPDGLTAFGGKVYFQADDGTNGYELWSTNGTSAGTTLVKDINTTALSGSNPYRFTAAGPYLYFNAFTPALGTELWRTDGTTGGTVLLSDLNPGAGSSNAFGFSNINGTLYFTATNGTTGNLIYKTNGTTAGTIKATSTGIIYDSPYGELYYNKQLLFSANTASNGNEPLTMLAEPLVQPTSLLLTSPTETTLSVSFTAAAGAAGYIAISNAGSAPTGLPIDGPIYSVGASLAGGTGVVSYQGSGTSFTDTNLASESKIYYAVYSYIYDATANVYIYRPWSPLTGSQFTFAYEPTDQPTGLIFSNVLTSSFTVSFTEGVNFPIGYLAIRNTGPAFPSGAPVDGVTYTVGSALGDGTVAYIGSATTFDETLPTTSTSYFYSIFSYNGTTGTYNYLVTAPLQGSLVPDTTPPVITVTPTSVASGSPLTISATVTEPESGIYSVYMDYRSISGDGTFTYADLTLNTANSKYEFTIPSVDVGELGVEYTVYAYNTLSMESQKDGHVRISTTGQTIPYTSFGSAVTNYRMISVPLVLTNKTVTDVFGAKDNTKYRLFHYAGTSTTAMGPSDPIDLGKGYWLIIKDSKVLSTGAGNTADIWTAQPFTITLSSGWNQIGNPYNFNVSWADVLAASSAPSLVLRTYNGNWGNGTQLNKFEGGFVMAPGTVTLTFPVTKNPAVNGRIGEQQPVPTLSNRIDQPDWEVNLTLRNGDRYNVFGGVGMHTDANKNYDKYDDFTLPRFLDYIELNHQKSFLGSHYTKDVVPTEENHTWEFTVESNLEGPTAMSWDNSYFGTTSKQLVLLDVATYTVLDMKTTGSYQFTSSGSHSFKIVYGNESYVKKESLPARLLVNTVFPNPSDSRVTIGFTLPYIEHPVGVKINVLDLMGQSVSKIFDGELESGYHEVIWSGMDDDGLKPAQGIYLIQIKGEQTTQLQRVIIN